MGKIFVSIISARLTEWAEDKSHLIFQSHNLDFETTEGQLIEHTLNNRKSLYIYYVDFRKAFDSIDHTDIARCVVVVYMRSVWFDCTEPSLTSALQGKQGVQGAFAVVRGGSSSSNLLEPSRTT